MLDNEPTDGAVSLDGDTTTADAGRGAGVDDVPTGRSGGVSAPRRRAASRPAGPPPEPDDLPPPVTTVAAGAAPKAVDPALDHGQAEAAAGVPAPVAEDRPKRATRRRATAKAVADVAEPAAQAAEPAPVAQPLEPETAAVAAEPAGPEEDPQPVRRRRSRKRVEEPAADAEQIVEQAVEAVEQAVEPPARRRRSRKKDEVTPERSRAMSAAEAEVAAALRLNLPDEEPLDDDILDLEPLDEDVVEDVAEDEGGRPSLVSDPFGLSGQQPAVPSVTFQAPALFQPLFQAPDPFAVPAPRPAAQPDQPAQSGQAGQQGQPGQQGQAAYADQADDQAEPEELDEAAEDGDDAEGEGGPRRRRRRRGGRGRGARTRDGEDGDDEPEADEAQGEQAEDEDREQAEDDAEGGSASSRRRRRRRRRGAEEPEPTVDDPPNTVVRIRAPRATRSTSADEVQGVRGSTRLEAKKQRRREGRELGRRRPPIITESEFLARREAVERFMVVRRQGGRTQIAVLEDGVLVEHYVDRESSQSYVGNVYLGKVQNVLPSMEAAFVDIGKGRNAVLYAGEVNFDTAGMEGQPKRIEAALKSGQSVLVQVTKDPMGHKGARLTSQISLPGRYLVYVPDGSMTGISRKLPDKERTRLKQILRKVMPENAGVIVRTAAEGASEEELSRDVARLSAQWENIQRKAKSASPPELLSGEPDMTVRVVRDVFNEDFASLVVEGEDAWVTVDEYVRYVAPHLADRISKWDGPGDAFSAYRIDEQIAKAMERKVWLPSGGSLVIDRTEAMTVVDVNTGKYTGQGGNLEETVTRNNLEAAEEIVRQLRLRDIGGIIVIDFIDMVLESNRDLVLRRLLECLARDRTKHQVAEVTSLGLVQMTRKRVGQGLLEAFSTPCECCHGRGIVISTEPVEGKPEPRGTQGKMAVEKAVAEKLASAEGSVAAASGGGRDGVTDAFEADEDDSPPAQPRGRRRSRRKAAD